MAVKWMDVVFKSRLSFTPVERLVLLALCNHANKVSRDAWPGIR